MSFEFDYELQFTNAFDQSVIDSSNVPDKSGDFTVAIQAEVDKITNILKLYPGVNTMSTFTNYNSQVYKITVNTV